MSPSDPRDILVIDVGGTYTKWAIYREGFGLYNHTKKATEKEDFLLFLNSIIKEYEILRVNIALPGVVHKESLTVKKSLSLNLQDFQFSNQMFDQEIELKICSDAFANVLGEVCYFGFSKLFFTSYVIGTGVGLGQIENKEGLLKEVIVSSHGGNYQTMQKCCNSSYCIEPVLSYKKICRILNTNFPNIQIASDTVYDFIKNLNPGSEIYNFVKEKSIISLSKHIVDNCPKHSKIVLSGGFGSCFEKYIPFLNKCLNNNYDISISKIGNLANLIGLAKLNNS